MDYMADVKPLEDRGLADEQVASILSSLTVFLLPKVSNI